jgi:hypothetical protein
MVDPNPYCEGWNAENDYNSLIQPTPKKKFEWWNPSFGLYKLLFAKIVLNHARGASIVGLASDRNLDEDDFKDYIKPVAKMIMPPNMKFTRPSEPYLERLGCPCQIFELLSPKHLDYRAYMWEKYQFGEPLAEDK